MKDEEMNLVEIETPHTLGSERESHIGERKVERVKMLL
jgi:hypothetical protein